MDVRDYTQDPTALTSEEQQEALYGEGAEWVPEPFWG
jgi:hypothetical protein